MEDRVDELARKFGDKLAQTRRDDAANRLLIAARPEAEERDVDSIHLLQNVGARLVRAHDQLGGVMLVARVWLESKRFGCVGRRSFPRYGRCWR